MIAQELTSRIKDYFDLNLYETKVWLALLGKGMASVGEVATISRVPRSRVYDVLESLEKKGFAIVKMGKPVKYLGIKPQIILERIKGDIRKNAEEKVRELYKKIGEGFAPQEGKSQEPPLETKEPIDIELLEKTDELHYRLSSSATHEIMRREYEIFHHHFRMPGQ